MKPCPHCRPYTARTHLPDKIFFWVGFCGESLLSFLPQRIRKTVSDFLDRVWILILQVLRLVGVVKFEKNPDCSKLRNRGLVFFDAGREASVDVRSVSFFGNPSGEYTYVKEGRRLTYQEIPEMKPRSAKRIDDKVVSKKLFAKKDLPHARGETFFSTRRALTYGQSLGFPLVAKPTNGSLSKHVTTDIKDEEELKRAIKIAKQYSPRFIVERFIEGKLYRATVLGAKQVFVCRKRLANVVGNGKKTIRELIEKKNKNPLRGSDQRNTTLHKIAVPSVRKFLKQSNLSLASVPKAGERIFLSNLYTLKAGCDIIEVTENVHNETKEMFLRAAEKLGVGLVGFDFIAKDITRSYKEQGCALLEANSLPYADMHRFPSEGKPQNIGKAAWKILGEEK